MDDDHFKVGGDHSMYRYIEFSKFVDPRSLLCEEAKIKKRTSSKKELCEIGEKCNIGIPINMRWDLRTEDLDVGKIWSLFSIS